MASIFDIFSKPAAPAPAPAQPQAAPGTPAASAATNPTVPNATNIPVTATPEGTAAQSPLDKYSELWKNDPTTSNTTEPFSFNTDPVKVMEAARGVEFTRLVTPELLTRVNAGGADGQKAMMEAMNQVAQHTFAQATHASSKIAEQAVSATEARMAAMLPNLIKQYQVADSVRTANPLLTNPAAAPMVEALQVQMTRKYPQATTQEINAHVSEYLDGISGLIQGQKPVPEVKSTGRTETDWTKFLE